MDHHTRWNSILRIGAVILGMLVCLMAIYLSFYLKFGGDIPIRNLSAYQSMMIWVGLAYVIINILFGTYIFYNKNIVDLFFYSTLSQLTLSIFMMALTYAGSWLAFPRSVVLINFFVSTICLFIYNSTIYALYHRLRGRKKVMVVGPEDRVIEAVKNFSSMNNHRHQVTHVVLSHYFYNMQRYIKDVDIVYLTGHIEEEERLAIYEYLMNNNKKLFLSTNFENLMMVNPNIMNFQDESVIEVSGFSISDEEAVIKRLIDITVSLGLIVVTLPIMLITAIAIKLDSEGPILYKQERITLDNQPFNILKFRSMLADAESKSGPMLAQSNDSRITKVGKFIRATRIDELPQLINVLKGDMSLVGPRPERPYFVKQFVQQNPYYSLRHHVRAGITGYAQVYGKYSTDFNSKLNFDLLYIKNYSIAFDFKLLFQTVKILFDKVSSRGVEETTKRSNQWDDYADQIKIIR